VVESGLTSTTRLFYARHISPETVEDGLQLGSSRQDGHGRAEATWDGRLGRESDGMAGQATT
jgi:hypothetical protein